MPKIWHIIHTKNKERGIIKFDDAKDKRAMRVNAQQRLLILLKIRLNNMKIAKNDAIIAKNNAIIAKLMAEEKAEKK